MLRNFIEEHWKKFGYAFLFCVLFTRACSPANREWLEENSPGAWANQGFQVEGTLGYQWGWFFYGDYGGAKVWYTLTRQGNDITYSGYTKRWGDEVHIYHVSAIDAIRPK